VVDVTDPLDRYLPLSFEVELPFRGPFRGEGAWLPRPLMLPAPAAGKGPGVFLWSAAGRAVPAGLTAIYAQVVIGDNDEPPPAAYAVVAVMRGRDGTLVPHAYGITDEQGRLNLPMPYPTVPQPPANTPYPPLGDQTFDLTIRVFCQPAALSRLPGSSVPDQATILGQAQAAIALRRLPGAPPALTLAPGLRVHLPFGVPLVLRTQTADPQRPEAFLRVQPV
jgi:hypothetical protein